MPKIKWTKADVIKKFEEAVNAGLAQSGSGQRPNVIKSLLDRAKKIPGRLGGQSV